ncbi:hypothetical protein GKODMF_05490 [Candidatus Electrothrix gigas]
MKLCITAAGNGKDAATDAAFGRAPWFILVDTATEAFQAVENTSAQATQGAGIAAAQTMSENGVDAVLTGRLGPKAKAALEASGITMYEGLGQSTVAEALQQFQAGNYTTGTTRGTTGASSASPTASCTPRGNGAGQGRGGNGQGNGQGRGGGQGRGKGGCGCGRGTGGGQGRRRGQ